MVNALTTTDMYPYALPRGAGRQGRRARRRSRSRSASSTTAKTPSRSRWTPSTARCTSTRCRTTRSSAPGPSASPASSSRAMRCPQPVRAQLNYPLQWFHLQFDDIYKRYHMRDPIEFYNVEDLWDDADEVLGSLGRGLEEFGTTDEMTFSYEGYQRAARSGRPAGRRRTRATRGPAVRDAHAVHAGGQPQPALAGHRAAGSRVSTGRLVNLRVPQGVFIPGPRAGRHDHRHRLAGQSADRAVDPPRIRGHPRPHDRRAGERRPALHRAALDLVDPEPLAGSEAVLGRLPGAMRHGDERWQRPSRISTPASAPEQQENELPWFESAQKEEQVNGRNASIAAPWACRSRGATALRLLLIVFILTILVPDADGPSPWDRDGVSQGHDRAHRELPDPRRAGRPRASSRSPTSAQGS